MSGIKGKKPKNFYLLHTPEAIKKSALKRKGLKLSEETKKKISDSAKRLGFGKWMKGRKLSEETKRKMSFSRKGQIPWNKGKKHTEEWKMKMSKIMKGRKITWGDKISKSQKGKPHFNQRGILNRNWKGGITPLIFKIRDCYKYRQWRRNILTKNNFTCQICRATGVRLIADHYPKLFSTIFHEYKLKSLEEALNCEELWNINNGRTLCVECHLKFGLKVSYLKNTFKGKRNPSA